MPRQTKHDRHSYSRNLTPREDRIRWLVRWLNEKTVEGRLEHKRVRDFLILMQDAQRLAREFDGLPDTTNGEHPIFERQFHLVAKIKHVLKNYPAVYDVRLYPPKVVADLELVKGNRQRVQEFGHIQTILEMAEQRPITDIRECNCGKLFLGRSSLTRFCSPDCRIAFWENSEERKRQKRDKAREYYMLHKAGIVKSASKRKAGSTRKKGR